MNKFENYENYEGRFVRANQTGKLKLSEEYEVALQIFKVKDASKLELSKLRSNMSNRTCKNYILIILEYTTDATSNNIIAGEWQIQAICIKQNVS